MCQVVPVIFRTVNKEDIKITSYLVQKLHLHFYHY